MDQTLTEEDKTFIRKHDGENAIIEVPNDAEKITETWALWHEAPHFHFSGQKDRHYRMNRMKNEIIFGDGIKGLIPPIGRNNIKAHYYQFGGGDRGNVNKGDINKLRTTIPFVSNVFNIIPSLGGRDIENMDRIRQRGADVIKFQQRTVTVSDFESLATIYSREIARVKAIPNTDTFGQFKPGFTTLLILANSAAPRPLVNLSMIREISRFVREKSAGHLNQLGMNRMNIITPKYVRLSVQAYVSVSATAYHAGRLNLIEDRIGGRLRSFLHPVTGGQKGAGWRFGENIPVSEIVSEIEQTEGVSSVSSLTLKPSMQQICISPDNVFNPTASFPKHSLAKVGAHQQYLLAEGIGVEKDERVEQILATGFREEDEVEIRKIEDDPDDPEVLTLKIKSVDKNIICFEAADILETYPIGSIVETTDGRIRSYLTRVVPVNIYGSLNEFVPLEIEVATPEEEKIYYFNDDFDDDKYSDTWEDTFLPKNLADYEGFGGHHEFETYPLQGELKTLCLDENRFLVLYTITTKQGKSTRVVIGTKQEDNSIEYSKPQTVPLGTRSVRRYYHEWVWHRTFYWRHWWHEGWGWRFAGWGWWWFAWWGLLWRHHHQDKHSYSYRRLERKYKYVPVPIEIGYLSLVKMNGGKFAICFSDQKNNHNGLIMISDYSTTGLGTDGLISFGPRVSFADHAEYIDAVNISQNSVTTNRIAISYKDSSGKGHLWIGGIKKYYGNRRHYISLLRQKQFEDISPSSISVVSTKDDEVIIGYIEGGKGYMKKAIYKAKDTVDISSISEANSIDGANIQELVLQRIDLNRVVAVFTRRDDSVSQNNIGKAVIIGVNENLNLSSEIFTTSNKIRNLKVGHISWVKDEKYSFLIGYRDGINVNRPTLVRAEIEDDGLQYNVPVVANNASVNNLDILVFAKSTDGVENTDGIESTDTNPVRLGVVYTSKKKGFALIGSELGLYGRALPDEEKFLREKNGFLTLDTGVAFENTPKRFYLLHSKTTFRPQSFRITMNATIGEYVESNYSIFFGLFDNPAAMDNVDDIPTTGIQLRTSRVYVEDDGSQNTEEDENDPRPEIDNDTNVLERISLFGGMKGEGEDKVKNLEEVIIPDGSLASGIELIFELTYDISKEIAEGTVTGRSNESEVFKHSLTCENVVLTKESFVTIGVANLMDFDPNNSNDTDVDIRSRAEARLDLIESNLEIRPFTEFDEDKLALVNKNNVTENLNKRSAHFRISMDDGMNQVYLDEQNLVYSGTHVIEANI